MENLRFVDACTDAHFATMSLLHALGWRTTYEDAIPADYMVENITDDRWVPFFRTDYETKRCHGLLLYSEDTPVACATYGAARIGQTAGETSLVSFDSSRYAGWGELMSLYTHPEEKSKGYGGRLIEEVLLRLRRSGYPSCFVFVLRENQGARRFYARHGFAHDGTEAKIPFPNDFFCVDLRYVRAL